MLDNQIFNWTLTGVLLVTAGYHALRAVKASHLVGKANNALHTIMGLSMTATLWSGGQWATLSAVLLLSSGALWFVIQAVARPEFKSVCAEKKDRTKCFYHGITMAAGAYMVTAMTPATIGGPVDLPVAATYSHHMASGIHQSIPTSSFDLAPLLHGGAVIFFGAAALIFAALTARSFKGASQLAGRTTLHAPHRPALGFEALSAGAMAAMYLAMLP